MFCAFSPAQRKRTSEPTVNTLAPAATAIARVSGRAAMPECRSTFAASVLVVNSARAELTGTTSDPAAAYSGRLARPVVAWVGQHGSLLSSRRISSPRAGTVGEPAALGSKDRHASEPKEENERSGRN